MNVLIRKRDKKIALLLSVAFAWLFIGSLIIFHQEHVLGKHIKLNSHLFISPKTKDKKDHTISLDNLLKYQMDGQSAGIINKDADSGAIQYSFELLFNEPACMRLHDALLTQIPPRAPPTA